MDKIEALEIIKDAWQNKSITLGEKIDSISEAYYSAGLDLDTTAAFIKATPAEFSSLLELSEFDDDIIEEISKVNPPKTTWSVLASASDDEILQALKALENDKDNSQAKSLHYTKSEFVFQKMVEVSGPTVEQKISSLTGDDLKHLHKKGTDFNALNDWQSKFLKSVAGQKKRGKTLSDKQAVQLIKIIRTLIDRGAIKRNSIDGDKEICDRILDTLGE